MAGALSGIRVLEFSEIIAAPFAGMLLADMGADVIKVEPVWGEAWRLNTQLVPLESRGFIGVNRGKRSLPLDLTKPRASEIVQRLVRDTDVVLINYRPDVPAKLGIDYESLSRINPRLIYCENTAFGRSGPDSMRPGYDIIAQAMTGLMATDEKVLGGVPAVYTSTPFVDFSTGIAMAWGVTGALFARERTGRGQRVDATLLGTGLAVQGLRNTWIEAIDGERHGEFMRDVQRLRQEEGSFLEVQARFNEYLGRKSGSLRYYYRTYQTKDGVVAVGCLSDSLRQRLLDALGIDSTGIDMADTSFSATNDRLMALAEEVMATRTNADWLDALDAAGVPAGPVRYAEELWDDPQVQANGIAIDVEHSTLGRVRMTAPIVKMSDTPTEARHASPALGEHTDEVLGSLGYSREDIERLRHEGVTR